MLMRLFGPAPRPRMAEPVCDADELLRPKDSVVDFAKLPSL